MSDSCRAIQQDGIENAQELACAYPEPPPTLKGITDSYHQNPPEECAKMQDEVPCINTSAMRPYQSKAWFKCTRPKFLLEQF